MKKKCFLIILFLILAIFLTGCWMIPPGMPEWMRAKQEVYSYWQAIINRQYELAKCYCIPGGVWDHKVDEWEEYININSEGESSVVIYRPSFYEQAEVIENNAIVYVRIITDITPFPGSNFHEHDLFEYEVELIRSPRGRWKLK